ncbi:hypothetical protein Syun_031124 [Stephania yunnanensis]|uniref:Uncharacterized protein n=1 Tax=Stephania yunnanensis TaxID=152371 RepID=A0AAP0HFU9_9MAGN
MICCSNYCFSLFFVFCTLSFSFEDDFPLFRIGSTGASLFTAGSKWMDMKNIVMVSDFMG